MQHINRKTYDISHETCDRQQARSTYDVTPRTFLIDEQKRLDATSYPPPTEKTRRISHLQRAFPLHAAHAHNHKGLELTFLQRPFGPLPSRTPTQRLRRATQPFPARNSHPQRDHGVKTYFPFLLVHIHTLWLFFYFFNILVIDYSTIIF